MTSTLDLTFTAEEIFNHAQENVTSLCLGMTAYLLDKDLPVDDFWAATGKRFAPNWGKNITARGLAEGSALNMLSGGTKLVALTGDDNQAEVVITNWPAEGMLEFFGLTQEEADSTVSIFAAIAAEFDFDCQFARQEDELRLIFSHF